MKQKYIIAVFDFDGTITKKDTLNDFILWNFGVFNLTKQILKLIPFILLYLLRLLPNHVPKQRLFSHFFTGIQEEKFKKMCRDYSLKRIDEITRKKCIEKIKWHRKRGHRLVIISASIVDWIKPWADKHLIDEVIATETEVQDDKLTGNFCTVNCYGKEKVIRFLEMFPDRDSYFLYVYGNSRGDKELLRLADVGMYRRFR